MDVASTYRERCCVATTEGHGDALKCKDIPGIHQTMHLDSSGTEMEFIGLRTCKEHDQCASGSFCATEDSGSASDLPIVLARYCSPPQPASSDARRSPCYRSRDCESGICINAGLGFAGYCLKGASEGYQKNGEVCIEHHHCASGSCKDWAGAGIANEKYCLGAEQDICGTLAGATIQIAQGLYSSPDGHGLNQHPKNLGNGDHDQYNCRSDYYCSLIDGATDLPWAGALAGYRRCTRDLPRTHPCSENAHCASGSCYCGTCFEVGGMKGGEVCAGGDPSTGYNAGDCVSNRCIDWIGQDTECSRLCFSMLDEPCETRSPTAWPHFVAGGADTPGAWTTDGDFTHVSGANRDTQCLGPESGHELSCWENQCTDKPPKGASCYSDASCQNAPGLPVGGGRDDAANTMCEQGVCTKASAIPGGGICRNHGQCQSGHCWEWYVCFFELSLASLDTTYTHLQCYKPICDSADSSCLHPSPFTCAQV